MTRFDRRQARALLSDSDRLGELLDAHGKAGTARLLGVSGGTVGAWMHQHDISTDPQVPDDPEPPPAPLAPPAEPAATHDAGEEREPRAADMLADREMVQWLLDTNDGSPRDAAAAGGVALSSMYLWMRRHGIPVQRRKRGGPHSTAVRDPERLAAALAAHGNAERAANALGVSRRTVARWAKRHGLR